MTYDVAVVGGGIVGAAVAFHAVRLGGRVVVIDGQKRGAATRQSTGMVRVHQPDLALAPLSYLGWQEFAGWEDIVGGPSPFRVTGCVHEVGAVGASLGAEVRSLQKLGWRCSIVGADDLAALYPVVAWAPGMTAVYEPDAGWADAAACQAGYLARVEELGGCVRRDEVVHDLIVEGGAARGVRIGNEEVGADAVVLATGAWSAVDGVRTRRIVWQEAGGAKGPLPCYVREGPEPMYFRPADGGRVRFGVGCDDWGVAPEAANRGIDDRLLERGRDRIAAVLGITPSPATLIAAVDCYTADQRPILDRSPDTEGVYLAVGFSGGGFKTAPAVGALLARWLATGRRDDRLSEFSVRQPVAAPGGA